MSPAPRTGRPYIAGVQPRRPPAPLTSFTAREDAVAAVEARLRRSRTVTITGPGGAGKTRLAIEVAGRRGEQDVAFADLTSVVDGEDVPRALLDSIGGASDGAATANEEEALAAALAGAGPVLLVLDNCEQVADATATLVTSLLGTCRLLSVLATSRRVLGVPGEAVVPIEGLAVPPAADASPDSVATYPAVQLFVDRAELQDPSFTLEGDGASAVAEICRMVDGLPLAIELVAPLVRTLAPPAIVERLRGRRLVLEGRATLPERQRSLASLIDWSSGLISERAETLLRRVSFFVDGFTIEAAEEVCAGDELTSSEVVEALTELVDHSLVQRHEGAAGIRYRLLETVREHTFPKLAGGVDDRSDHDPPDRGAVELHLVPEGEVWAVGVGDTVVRLKSAKGFSHIHRLIAAEGQEIHVLDLSGADATATTPVAAEDAGELRSTGDAGLEVIDRDALEAYRRRYRELAAELDEASAHHDPGRVEGVRAEMAALADEISAATGLGGRPRHTGGSAERARVAVTKAIRTAIGRIVDTVPELGEHLDASITTGTTCSYRPPGDRPRWRL